MITFDIDFWICVIIKDRKMVSEFERVQEIIENKYKKKYEHATCNSLGFLVASRASNISRFIQILGNKGLLGKTISNVKEHIGEIEFDNTEPILISDENNLDFFNQINNFKKTNSLLLSMGGFRNGIAFIPDIGFCRKLLKTIDKELQSFNGSDFLDGY